MGQTPASPRVAIYARVSTSDQNCEMQLGELRGYVSRCGWQPAAEYVDTGVSGTKTSRPQLNRLMSDARKRKLDVVVVWKLDRWGRSLQHCLTSIQELAGLKVRWIAYTQNLDTDQNNPMARLLLGLLALIAEFEREMIRERVTCGLHAAMAKGVRVGRPTAVFDRGRAMQLKRAGKSARQIAAELGSTKSVVLRSLRKCPETAPKSPPGRPPAVVDLLQEQQLRQAGTSVRKAAAALGIAKSVVHRRSEQLSLNRA